MKLKRRPYIYQLLESQATATSLKRSKVVFGSRLSLSPSLRWQDGICSMSDNLIYHDWSLLCQKSTTISNPDSKYDLIIISLIKSQSDQHYYLSPTDFPCIQISLKFNQAVFPMSEYTEKPMHFGAWKFYTKKYKKTSNLVYLVIRRMYLIFRIVYLVP